MRYHDLSMWRVRGLLVSVAAIVGCSGDAEQPPRLPGEGSAPCILQDSEGYLVDELGIPSAFAVDLSVPPDGVTDTQDVLAQDLEKAIGSDLDAAVTRSVTTRHVLLVVTVQTCADASGYARVDLRRGLRLVAPDPNPSIELVQAPHVPAVGTVVSGTVEASDGIGIAPVALLDDLAADTSDTAWFPAYGLQVAAQQSADHESLSGNIAFAVDYDDSVPSMAVAIARTFTLERAAQPDCPPTCGEPSLANLFALFDVNHDGQFDPEEVLLSHGLETLGFGPDLDLLVEEDGARLYWPSHDGMADSRGSSYAFSAHRITVQ